MYFLIEEEIISLLQSCLGLQLYSNRDSDTGVFLWILWNFQEHHFYRTRLGAASAITSLALRKFYLTILSSFYYWTHFLWWS